MNLSVVIMYSITDLVINAFSSTFRPLKLIHFGSVENV